MWAVEHYGQRMYGSMWAVEHDGNRDARAIFNIGYAIGLIVGEGCFTGDFRTPTLSVRLHETDPEPLYLLRGLFGSRVYGPYCHSRRRYRVWHLRGDELYDAVPTFMEWMPISRKRTQLLAWLRDRIVTQPIGDRA